MKKIPFLFSVVAVLLASCLCAAAEDAQWLSDYQKAVNQAKTTQRNILMDFTGSDWCPWCIKMDKEVLQSPQFKEYASKNLVLMLVDFPRSHSLPKQVQDQNDQLQQKYEVEGFPTFILVDKDGKVMTKFEGYVEGGPSSFIAMLQPKK